MDYEISIITRNQIPSEIFLYDEYDKDDKDDFKYIHLFEFNNGINFGIGSNYRIYDVEEIIETLETDYNITTEYNKDPDELQEYYKDEFDIFYKYRTCEKIWNYYYNNKQLIKDIINYYKYEEVEESDINEEIINHDDEGIDIISNNSDDE